MTPRSHSSNPRQRVTECDRCENWTTLPTALGGFVQCRTCREVICRHCDPSLQVDDVDNCGTCAECSTDHLAVPLTPIRMQDFQPAIERIKRSL